MTVFFLLLNVLFVKHENISEQGAKERNHYLEEIILIYISNSNLEAECRQIKLSVVPDNADSD